MSNNIRQLREKKGWSLQKFAEEFNDVLEKHPDLKKKTARNPDGVIDYQTLGRIELGDISLEKRHFDVLYILFKKTPDEILGYERKTKEDKLNYHLQGLSEAIDTDIFEPILDSIRRYYEKEKK